MAMLQSNSSPALDANDGSVRRDGLIQRPRCIKLAGQIGYTI